MRDYIMQVKVIHSAFEDSDKPVALVDIPDDIRSNVDTALEYAYRWTQNIMDSWSLKGDNDGNENVQVITELPVSKSGRLMGLRSTSVGDRMLIGHVMYRVSPMGFEKV
jgi:hypothetical protein